MNNNKKMEESISTERINDLDKYYNKMEKKMLKYFKTVLGKKWAYDGKLHKHLPQCCSPVEMTQEEMHKCISIFDFLDDICIKIRNEVNMENSANPYEVLISYIGFESKYVAEIKTFRDNSF